jgi:transposase
MDAVDTIPGSPRWTRVLSETRAAHQADQARNDQLERENTELQKQVAELQKQVAELQKQLANHAHKIEEPYSTRAEEQRQQRRGKQKKRKESHKQRRGRLRNDEKIKLAERTEDIYPQGVPVERCKLSHVRVVCRLLEGRAVRIAYRIFRGPKKQYGVIPGVLGRSEYGLEIVVELAFLVQQVGLSLDKLCQTVAFLQNLKLGKSQVEALLKQLSNSWSEEFEVLCALLANSLVVHTDETRWSINSVWAFLSEKARVLLFGVNKDAKTLKELLDPETFTGIVFSDDAAVYENFTAAQKCWAHLLRKAIKLTLQAPENAAYRSFADELLSIYHEAKRVQVDGRLRVSGRDRKEKELLRRLFALSCPVCKSQAEATGLDHDWWLLAEELVRLGRRDELFTFLRSEAPEQPNGACRELDGTNNEAERTLRGAAQARVTGRTSKTSSGARRTTILKSVLESLRVYLSQYTLRSVIEEVGRWRETGRSCFRELLDKLKIRLPSHSVLDRVLPHPEPSG